VGEPPSPQQVRANLLRLAERLTAAQGRLEKLIASFDNNELTPGEIPAEVEGILRTLREMGSGQRGAGGGGGGGGPGGGAGHGQQPGSLGGLFPSEPMRPLSPADRKAVRAIIAEHLPVVDREFEALAIKDDRMSERFIDALAPRVRPLPQLKKRDPELYTLHSEEVMNFVEVIRASKAIADARLAKDDAAKDNGRQALKAAIGRQVDTRLKIQDHQIGDLRRRAETLQGELTKSKSNREKLVNDKFALAEREADRPRGPLDNKDRKPARRRDEQPGKQPGGPASTPPDEAPTAEPKR